MNPIMTDAESPQHTLTADQALQQAVAHHQAGRLQDAERFYRAILQAQPNHPDANHNLGVLAVQVKQPAVALPHFKVALEANPVQGQYWLSYIDALIQAGQADAARQVLEQGRQRGLSGEAVEALAGRLAGNYPSFQEMSVLGTLFNEGRYAEAETLAEAMTARFPLHGFGWMALGASLQMQSKNALPAMQKATELSPDDANAHNNLGKALRDIGQFDEAVASCRRALEIKPDFAEAHDNLGIALKDLGQVDDAIASYRRALEIRPDLAEAHHNLSCALQDCGRFDEAVASCRRALEIKPDFAEAHNNLGNALHAQGRLDDAQVSYRQALQLKPDYAEACNNLGITFYELGRLDEAEVSLRRALQVKPDYVGAHNNLGNVLQELGRLEEAEVSLRRALQLKPDYAEAHNNLGNALKDLGQLDEAVASYRRALVIKPDFTDALSNLALLFNVQGKLAEAMNIIKQSLQIKETAEAKIIFVNCIKRLHCTHDDSELRIAMVRALTEPWGRPNELARFSIELLKTHPGIGGVVARATDAWPVRLSAQDLFGLNGLAAVAEDPLLNALLISANICDIGMERFLTMARHAMLEAAIGMTDSNGEIGTALNFYSALARQCFISEYVFVHTDDEIKKAGALRDALVAALETNTRVPALWPVAVAAYFPLGSLPLPARLLAADETPSHSTRLSKNNNQVAGYQWPDEVMAVLEQQVCEPAEELKIRATLPRLTDIEDEVSLLVQGQYEENPYPRWVKAAPVGKAKYIDGYLCQKFPLSSFKHNAKSGRIDILIAGCGTGQHSIGTAQQFQGAQVLAVDLSISSLSYAKRKTQELGLTSIEYAQADILKLGSLGRSFDVIESAGVLHHLADPWAGWQVLLSLLRPGGVMKLGFYSEVARRNIVRARAFIAEQGYASTADEIRRCRQDLVELDKSADLGNTIKSSDFFSVSTCRDLLFHVQEHRLTLAGIDEFLRENNLVFLGFEVDANDLQSYRLRFPEDRAATDLARWQIFENENPDTFSGMYQFWIQKADQADAARQVLEQGKQRGLNGEAVETLTGRLEESPECEPSPQEMNALIVLFNEGRYAEAESLARSMTARYPLHGFGWKVLGALFKLAGRSADALEAMQRAAEFSPGDAEAHSNLGVALRDIGKLEDAAGSCHLALIIKPDLAEAHSNLGNILYDIGRLNEAEARYRQALQIKPDYTDARYGLGNTLMNLERLEEAEACYWQVLQIRPDDAKTRNNLGATLRELGRLDEAEASCRQALQLKPGYAEAHCNLGVALQDMGRLDDAEASYRRALEIQQDFDEALFNLGQLLRYLDDPNQATALYQKTLDVAPARKLDAAVCLAILHYLEGKLEPCRAMLLASHSIVDKPGLTYKNMGIYWHYLDKLLLTHQQPDQGQTQNREPLHVIGESHSLSAHGVVVRYDGQEMRCTAEWIDGCKQWHLGNGKPNKYKHKFEAVMARLPRRSTLLLLIGEIDCRHDEGMIKAWRKSPDKKLEEIAQATASAYVLYVGGIAAQYGHRIIVGGVPATNIQLDTLAAEAAKQLVELIRIFNAVLKKAALAAGMDFLDVYALTDRGDGIATGEWHIDSFHLLPSAVTKAFDKCCIRGDVRPASSAVSQGGKKTLKAKPAKKSVSHKGGNPGPQEMNVLVALFNGGQFAEVETLARQMTVRYPQHGFGWKVLGAVLTQMGRSADALDAMQKAAALSPGDAEAHSNLGVALQGFGRLDDAVESYRRALQSSPDYSEAHNNLGNALKDLGRLEAAAGSYRRALEIQPDLAEAHSNLGVALKDIGRLDDAAESCRRALQIRPDYAEAHNNLGNILKAMGRLDEAAASYRRTLQILNRLKETDAGTNAVLTPTPKSSISHLAAFNYGQCLEDRGFQSESVFYHQQAFFERVGWQQSDDPDLSPGLANAYFELTNKCNFHCDFCPSDSQKRPTGFMSPELAKRLYDEVAEKSLVPKVNLHLMGEPTLHPDLVEVLAYASAKNVATELVSNGSTLTAKTAQKILGALYGVFAVSLQTPTKSTFKHRGDCGLGWDKYIGNIRLLIREHLCRISRHQSGRNTIELRVMVTRNSRLSASIIETDEDIKSVLEEWCLLVAETERELGLPAFQRQFELPQATSTDTVNLRVPLQQGLTLTFWQGFSFANSMLGKEYRLECQNEATFCSRPFLDVAVLANGDVTLCCLDYDGQLAVGNIHKNSIEDVLSGQPTRELRAAMLGRSPLPPYCRQCQARVSKGD